MIASVNSRQSRRSADSVRLYPLKVQEMDMPSIPYQKKKTRHLKKNAFNNFYKETPASYKPKHYNKLLDGFLLLQTCKVEKPNEVIRVNLQGVGISSVAQQDLREFINLSTLDLSDNQVRLEQLRFLDSLTTLNLMCNKISSLPVLPSNSFRYLENLTLSYNKIPATSILQLSALPRLKVLDLSSNELCALPEDLSKFKALTELRIASNAFSTDSVLFSATTFFSALASLPKIVKLDLSRNKLRGIHSEGLPQRAFPYLKTLDFSYNWVDSQEDLMGATQFSSLETLDITGNPFAQQNNYAQLEAALADALGTQVLNDLPYKKKEKFPIAKPIAYINQEQSLKNTLFASSIEAPKIESPPKELEDPYFFLTETENESKLRQRGPTNKLDEFRSLARDLLSDEKAYDRPVDLQTAYRQLKHLVKHPLTYQSASTASNRRHSSANPRKIDALAKANAELRQINEQLNLVDNPSIY